MKVEQLKAELVVFKGLMSNVSAATTPLTLFPCGSSSGCLQPGRTGLSSCGLSISCPLALPSLCYASVFFRCHPLIQEKKKEHRPRCRVGPAAWRCFSSQIRTQILALRPASIVALGKFLSRSASLCVFLWSEMMRHELCRMIMKIVMYSGWCSHTLRTK